MLWFEPSNGPWASSTNRDNEGVEKAFPSVERFFQFALLGLVASGYLAIAGSGYVDLPTVVLAGAGLAWRMAIISGAERLQVSDRVVAVATLAYMLFAPLDYFLLSKTWVAATVHVVFFVAVVKTLTARVARDYLFVAAVAFIEILAAALLSSSGTFFVCLMAYLLCAVAALAASQVRGMGGPPPLLVSRNATYQPSSRLLAISVLMTCGILVLTAGLFFILPRTANAALRFLASNRYHLTGFSNDVMLGEVGELKNDTRAVMHVKSYSRELPLNLKWRGLALERFDGRRWSTDPAGFRTTVAEQSGMVIVADDWQRRRLGRHLWYRVDIQNVDADALFVAGIPETLNTGATRISRAPNGAFRFGFVPNDSIRYEVYSFLGPETRQIEPHSWHLSAAEREQNLSLPKIDPRIAPLARELTAGANSDAQRAALLEQRLRKDYGYSLELGSEATRDPLADFLFVRRKGYCEYFASAMTVMMRTLGMPARLVNGFQSGIANPYSDMLIIRASDAHTWVEVFLPETGWTVFDPTPGTNVRQETTLWSKVNLYLDAADTFWREWVLSYDLGQQLTLASRVELQARRVRQDGLWSGLEWIGKEVVRLSALLRRYIAVLALLLGGLLGIGFAGMRLRHLRPAQKARWGRSEPRDATVLYGQMLRLLRKRGYQKPPWFTPAEFATTVPFHAARDLERFTVAYNAVRFGGDSGASREMAEAMERLAAEGSHD